MFTGVAISLLTAYGTLCAGDGKRRGWIILWTSQVLWIPYDLLWTWQPWFLIITAVTFYPYWKRWRNASQEETLPRVTENAQRVLSSVRDRSADQAIQDSS